MENRHDNALVDERGQLVTERRISDDITGFRVLVELLAEHGDQAADSIRSRSSQPRS